jgi:DNA mismatch repair protein MutS2
MSWPIGADVVIRTLGNKRGVVLEAGRGGQYRLRVEGVTVWCREADLAAAPAGKQKKHGAAKRRETHGTVPSEETAPPGRVDLHGLSVEEAIARVIDEIDRALLRGANRVEVVHGKGSGRIRDALHRHLAALPVVAAFDLDRRNPGVTWVYF